MFSLITINFKLEDLAKVKQPIGSIFITFSQFGDQLQRTPIYSISDGLRSLVLNKLTDFSWQILHSEDEGRKIKFSEKDYPFLREIRDTFQSVDSEFNLQLKENEIHFTESIANDLNLF